MNGLVYFVYGILKFRHFVLFVFQAEEESKSEKTSVSHSQTDSVVKKSHQATKQTFRPLNFGNIPLPSTGGQVTGEFFLNSIIYLPRFLILRTRSQQPNFSHE